MRNLITSSLIVLALFGCMAGPNYQRPTIEAPSSWRFEEKKAGEVANAPWWEQFDDPALDEIIQDALKENKDVKIAAVTATGVPNPAMPSTKAPKAKAMRINWIRASGAT